MRVILTLAVLSLLGSTASAETWRFDGQKTGEPPQGLSCALTGKGRPGTWTVVADASAPSASNVLVQADADSTSYRFPHCVAGSAAATDLDLSVRFKPVSGSVDQAAGLVWRYRDPDHYYVVRANALENNVVLYKVEGGRRIDLPVKGEGRTYGKKAPVPSGAWSTLAVRVRGALFEVVLDGTKLYEVEDATFAGPGRVGVWTKADSVTRFDDLQLTVVK